MSGIWTGAQTADRCGWATAWWRRTGQQRDGTGWGSWRLCGWSRLGPDPVGTAGDWVSSRGGIVRNRGGLGLKSRGTARNRGGLGLRRQGHGWNRGGLGLRRQGHGWNRGGLVLRRHRCVRHLVRLGHSRGGRARSTPARKSACVCSARMFAAPRWSWALKASNSTPPSSSSHGAKQRLAGGHLARAVDGGPQGDLLHFSNLWRRGLGAGTGSF